MQPLYSHTTQETATRAKIRPLAARLAALRAVQS
jgi:hypothetical protein